MGCGLAQRVGEIPKCNSGPGVCLASMLSRELHTMRSLRTFIVQPL